MKKYGLQTLIILILGFIAQQFFPFWIIAVVAGLVGLLFHYKNSATGFAAGFTAATLLWSGYAHFLNAANLNMLASKMGDLFQLKSSYLVYLTGLVGGLLGGLGAMTGSLGRKLFFKEKQIEAES